MSIQSASAAELICKYFDVLPADIVTSVFENQDKLALATAAVCKNWQKNADLERERQKASTQQLLKEYPQYLVEAFQNNYMPIHQLPVLNLGGRISDYIDFIQPEEMSQPVMRFRDRDGRPGIALNIHANKRVVLKLQLNELSADVSFIIIRDAHSSFLQFLTMTKRTGKFFKDDGYNTVLALFKRFTNQNRWEYGWGNTDSTMSRLYYKNRQEILFSDGNINETVLTNLLKGQDPDFSLGRKKGLDSKTLIITALAAIAIAYLANYYLHQINGSSS